MAQWVEHRISDTITVLGSAPRIDSQFPGVLGYDTLPALYLSSPWSTMCTIYLTGQ